jgi:hypothetical protein
MKAYAEKHGFDLQSFYLWKGRLKKLGVLGVNGESLNATPAVIPVALRNTRSCTNTFPRF